MLRLFRNIKGLVNARAASPAWVAGQGQRQLPVLDNAWMVVTDTQIHSFGAGADLPPPCDEETDLSGRFVFPCWVDSHTHIVFAGNREGEFVDRLSGLSYEAIASRGGGILNSAARMALADEDVLFEESWMRLDAMRAMGTGAVEIKSGYGLTTDAELKMLRVIRRLRETHPVTVRATFLGAHAIPAAYRDRREDYVDLVIEEMIPRVAGEGLADFIDVFCEKNYFTVDQSKRILEAGARRGLKAKVHVNQFNALGGVRMCAEAGVLSVDHLECLEEDDIKALSGSATMPVALPVCSLYLDIPFTPARRLLDAGLPLALASDFNPGSAPSGNMNLVNLLACTRMGMTPQEIYNAASLNGAYAMGLQDRLGTITPGKLASFIVSRPMHSPITPLYHGGHDWIERVYVAGTA